MHIGHWKHDRIETHNIRERFKRLSGFTDDAFLSRILSALPHVCYYFVIVLIVLIELPINDGQDATEAMNLALGMIERCFYSMILSLFRLTYSCLLSGS